jgi:serine protease Do
LILTNNHVVEGANELSVQFIDEVSVDATIKGTNEDKDIAVISVKLSDLSNDTINNIKIATLGDSTKLKVGNGIIAIGNALGYGQSVTTGVVSALDREVTIDNVTNKMIQIDAAINGGNSGGALLNSNGEVIGINSAKYSSSSSSSASIEGMGFAIPISDVSDLIDDLMNGTSTATTTSTSGVTLGIEGYMVNNTSITGFYISNVSSGSIASKNNLTSGMIITKIDGSSVTDSSVITNILKKKQSGDTLKLTILYQNGMSYMEQELTISL